MRHSFASVLAIAALPAFLLTGCKSEHTTNYHTDDSFIRSPGQEPKKVAMKSGPLLPMTVGNRWDMVVRQGDSTHTEQVVVTGTKVIEGVTGKVVEFRENGVVRQKEVYAVTKEGLCLLASGNSENLSVVSPPLVIAHLPIVEGDALSWNGMLRTNGETKAATAISRVSAQESIKTPAGTFGAYRIDTSVNIMGQRNGEGNSLTLRWMAPGIGVVRQLMPVPLSTTVREKVLTKYRLSQESASAPVSGGRML
jgi:hypothetical protein